MIKSRLFPILMAIVLGFSSISMATTKQDGDLTKRKDVQAFIQKMVKKHQFDASLLNQWLSQATPNPSILQSISKPAEKLPWYKYETIFMSDKRIQEGADFWRDNNAALKKAEKEYGVPPEIIVAIIGVESFYGKQRGKHKVLDSLVTLGFDYPPRSKFFLSELEQFLLLAREEHWDPTTITGSYAGAMGKPQFIASSYRRYAVDFSGKGKRDLIGNVEDSIGSVANYFKVHGWKKNQPIVFRANVKGEPETSLIASKNNPKPDHSFELLKKHGVSTKAHSIPNIPYALLALEGKNGPEYWLGAKNFYVITRYNHSNLYAMAVYQLSEKIKAVHSQPNPVG